MDADMLRLFVLDALTMDIECIDTMYLDGWAEKRQIAEALAAAMDDDLIEALEWGAGTYLGGYGRATPTPTADDIANDSYPWARYWFDLTPDGKQAWKDGGDRLDAYLEGYYEGHPEELPDD